MSHVTNWQRLFFLVIRRRMRLVGASWEPMFYHLGMVNHIQYLLPYALFLFKTINNINIHSYLLVSGGKTLHVLDCVPTHPFGFEGLTLDWAKFMQLWEIKDVPDIIWLYQNQRKACNIVTLRGLDLLFYTKCLGWFPLSVDKMSITLKKEVCISWGICKTGRLNCTITFYFMLDRKAQSFCFL